MIDEQEADPPAEPTTALMEQARGAVGIAVGRGDAKPIRSPAAAAEEIELEEPELDFEPAAGPSPLEWLFTDNRVNPGAFDTDDLDEELRGRHQAIEGADSLKWLYDGDVDTALTENRGPVSRRQASGAGP